MFRPFKLTFVVYILTTVGAALRDVKFTEWSLGSLKFGQILEFFSTGGLQISRVSGLCNISNARYSEKRFT